MLFIVDHAASTIAGLIHPSPVDSMVSHTVISAFFFCFISFNGR